MATAREVSADRAPEGVWTTLGSAEWDAFEVHPGELIEVRTEETDGAPRFVVVITDVEVHEDTEEETVKGRFIAYTDEKLSKTVGQAINRRGRGLHLCSQSPCDFDVDQIAAHVTSARWFSQKNFECNYLKAWGSFVLKEFREMYPEEPKKQPPWATPKAGPGRRRVRFNLKASPKTTSRRKPKKPKDGEPPADGGGMTGADLKKKLKDLKDKLITGKSRVESEVVDLVEENEESEEREGSPCAQERGLTTGSHLDPWLSQLALEDVSGRGRKRRKEDPFLEVKEEKDSGKEKDAKKKRMRKKKMDVKLSPLLAVAEQQERRKKARKEREKKKERGKRSPGVRALVKLLGGTNKKKSKKGDPSDPSESETSSEESGDEDEESSTESDMKAPLLRKAEKRPGSVMRMLVKHCQEALDQSSALTMEERTAVTSGVKLVTYFNLLVRPNFPSTSRDMKELYLLAVALDFLRSGKLQQVADTLSSRFLAVHCAASEGNWSAAKFLEMYPLEAVQSAPTDVLLKARKHLRLVQKSQGLESGGSSNRYHPGGGWKGGGQEDEKGKGKGKYRGGKGKGKGNQQQWQRDNWQQWQSREDQWWKKQKEQKEQREKAEKEKAKADK